MTTDPKPMHRWRGDRLGHNCADCEHSSVWRCDQAAHEEWRQRLRVWLAERADGDDKTAAMLLPGVDREIADEATPTDPTDPPAARSTRPEQEADA